MSALPAYAVVAAFLFVMLIVGLYSRRFVKTAEDFHRGGGQVPWWAAGLSIYMGAFSAFAFVSFGSVVFTDGGFGVLLGYGLMFAYVVTGLIFAKRWHRAGLTTPVAYLENRFGPGTRQLVAAAMLVINAISSALRLYAFALMMNGLLGVPVLPTIVVAGLFMAIIALTGGLWGIVLADSVQFVVLLAGLVPLVILSLVQIGDAEAVGRLLTTDLFVFDRGDKDWSWLFTWWALTIVTGNFSFPIIQRLSSVPTENDARKAMFLAAALLVPTPILALIPVVACFQLLPATPPELAFATMATNVLPIGLLGLMAGSMIAATVSELESAFNIDSGIVARDIYQRRINPAASDQLILGLARVATLASAAVATTLAIALAITGTGIFGFSEAVASFVIVGLCIPFLAGVLVRPISERGFFISLGASLTAALILAVNGVGAADARVPIISVGIAALLVAALIAPARGEEAMRIATFFERLREPRPNPKGASPQIDRQTLGLVGFAILLLGLIPLSLPTLTGTRGLPAFVEYAIAATLILVGASFSFIARRPASKEGL